LQCRLRPLDIPAQVEIAWSAKPDQAEGAGQGTSPGLPRSHGQNPRRWARLPLAVHHSSSLPILDERFALLEEPTSLPPSAVPGNSEVPQANHSRAGIPEPPASRASIDVGIAFTSGEHARGEPPPRAPIPGLRSSPGPLPSPGGPAPAGRCQLRSVCPAGALGPVLLAPSACLHLPLRTGRSQAAAIGMRPAGTTSNGSAGRPLTFPAPGLILTSGPPRSGYNQARFRAAGLPRPHPQER
jgi:hypothetical protein